MVVSGIALFCIGLLLIVIGLLIIGYGEETYEKGKMGRLHYLANYTIGALLVVVPLLKLLLLFLLGQPK